MQSDIVRNLDILPGMNPRETAKAAVAMKVFPTSSHHQNNDLNNTNFKNRSARNTIASRSLQVLKGVATIGIIKNAATLAVIEVSSC